MSRITSRQVRCVHASGTRQTSMPAKTEIAKTRPSGVSGRGGGSFPRARLCPPSVNPCRSISMPSVDVDRAEYAERDDCHDVPFERRLPQVEVDVAEAGQAGDASLDANASLALARAEDREHKACRLPARGRDRAAGRQVGEQLVELVLGARKVSRRHPVRELLERQTALDGVLAQCRDRLLPVGVRCTQSRCGRVGHDRSLSIQRIP